MFGRIKKCVDAQEHAASALASFYTGAQFVCSVIDEASENKPSQIVINVCNAFIAECR